MISRNPSLPITGDFCNFFWIMKFVCCIGINPKISHFYKERLISFHDFPNYLLPQNIYFPQTRSVHRSCHLHIFFQLMTIVLLLFRQYCRIWKWKKIYQWQKNKTQIYFFSAEHYISYGAGAGYYIRCVFPCILLFPLYVLLYFKKSTQKIPNGLLQMSLLFSSEKKNLKHPQGQKTVFAFGQYIWHFCSFSRCIFPVYSPNDFPCWYSYQQEICRLFLN